MLALNRKFIIGTFCFVIFIAGCTKVIDINLNDVAPQIVIEANIINGPGPYQVKITKTINFSDPNVFPGVSGAIVIISDITDGISDTLVETSSGIYQTKTISGLIGHTYHLSVLADGKLYTSSSTIPQVVPLDSISFIKTYLFGKIRINSVANFKDPGGINNYYGFNLNVNGIRKDGTQLFSDRLTDGKYISQDINADSLEIGNKVMIEMRCLDKSAYDYFRTLRQVTGGNNFQSVSPSNPISNISNNALGYFSAHTIQVKEAIVK